MNEYIITFGSGQFDEKNGVLTNCYTRIVAESEIEARFKISEIRGNKWCAIYEKEDGEKIVREYNVKEIPLNQLGTQLGETECHTSPKTPNETTISVGQWAALSTRYRKRKWS